LKNGRVFSKHDFRRTGKLLATCESSTLLSVV
jgi:hypothetical protein